jgi:hypothetical protein
MSTIEHLNLLGKCKNKAQLLRKCPNSLIKCVCECVLNLLKGNVPITIRHKNRIAPYKRTLRRLSDKKVPLFKKRKLLVQKGDGFLSILIPAAVTALTTLLHGTR